ncbi:type II CRISPR-associated endonuclease Cas1 [Alkaliphilus hydrothermalis]|uniref:type II CRISPR-associated endonuclease Cas1 n=1 Tax=Alkaliphilus hydrothermalis TaxID=1482730 RepID=UPI001FB02504|nr:type II CRISPR-associated endonuclease Cas1 [Alkaliphilus hydrothermalis]
MKVSKNQLVIQQGAESIPIPLEDISVIVIETSQATITTALMSRLADDKIAVFFCDEKHIPNSVVIPFQSHSRQNKILNTQISLSKPFINRCWQMIIKQKITNQSECLRLLKRVGYNQLCQIATQVQSGDKTNREAYAAKLYFNCLFENFTRHGDDTTNAALNFGYAILRGAIARTLTAYGFIPALGIHHCSELNNFNLADDFIEAYRPFVDLWVVENIDEGTEFSRSIRSNLLNILNYDCLFDGKKQKILRSIDMMISSFVSACNNMNFESLKLPELIPLELHSYE